MTGIVSPSAESVQSEGPTKARNLNWIIAAHIRGIIMSERFWITEWRVINVSRPYIKYFTLQGREESEKYGSLQKGRGLKITLDVAHISLIFYYAYKIWNLAILLRCLTFCCDARIQQIANVTPLWTSVHVSSLMCCTCFQKEIQNHSKLNSKKAKDSEV